MIGSVCDQASINSAAVHELIYPGREGHTSSGKLLRYEVEDHSLTHVYDVPHIWKSLRNNLLIKDLCHTMTKRWEITGCANLDKAKKNASWDHVVQLYELNTTTTIFLFFYGHMESFILFVHFKKLKIKRFHILKF